MPRINQNNNLDNNGMNPTNDTVRKLDQLKDSWYRQSPPKLFDLSVGVLVENIDLILMKTKKLNAKYYKKYLEKKADCMRINEEKQQQQQNETTTEQQQSTAAVTCDEISLPAPFDDDTNSTSNSLTLMETNKKPCATNSLSPYNNKKHLLVKSDFYSSNYAVSSSRKHQQFNPFYGLYVKYQLAEHVGPLPTVVCEAIIKKYAEYYLRQLGLIERQEYFQINKHNIALPTTVKLGDEEHATTMAENEGGVFSHKNSIVSAQESATGPSASASSRFYGNAKIQKKKLISYYDLVMAFSSRPDKCSLNKFEYRQCIWAHSTLEQRINAKKQNKKQSQQRMRDLFGDYSFSSSSTSSDSSSSSPASSNELDDSDTDNFSDSYIRSDDDGDNISKYYDCLDANYSNSNNNTNANNNNASNMNTSGSSNNMTIDRHKKLVRNKKTSNKLAKLTNLDNRNNSSDDLKRNKIVDLYKSKRRRQKQKKPKVWRSTRSKQPEHLVDMDLRVALKNHQIEYLDICPCKLTNESIALLNRYFSKNLKYLRFQNCCNWHLKTAQETHNQQQEQPNHHHPADRPNRIYHHDHLISDSESDSNDLFDADVNLMSDENENDEDESNSMAFFSEHQQNSNGAFDNINRVRRLELAFNDESQSNMNLVKLRSQLDKLDSNDASSSAAAATANQHDDDDDDEDDDDLDFQNDETSELQNFNKFLEGNTASNNIIFDDEDEEDEDDEDNDSYEFDAYLEEYLSRYDPNVNLDAESKNELDIKQNTFLNDQLKKKHSTKEQHQSSHHHHRHHDRQHHHHHHHHHHHRHHHSQSRRHRHHSHDHDHHHHGRRHRRGCRKHPSERSSSQRNDLMVKINKLISLHDSNRPHPNECLLFKASASKLVDPTTAKRSSSDHSRKRHSCSCKLDKLKSKLISSNNTIVGATSSNLNHGVDEAAAAATAAKSGADGKTRDESRRVDDENNSILKWFVKYAASAAAVSSKSALGLTTQQRQQSSRSSDLAHNNSPPQSAATTSEKTNAKTGAKSLLEQIKQKASILTETKMIDKVSITSSLNDTEGMDSKSNASNSVILENDATSNEYDTESIDYYNMKSSKKVLASFSSNSDDDKRFKINDDIDDEQYRRRRLKHLNENSIDSASLNSSSCNSSLCAAKIGVNSNDKNNNNNLSESPSSSVCDYESFSSDCSCCCGCSSGSSDLSYYSSVSSSPTTSNKNSSDEDEDFKSVNSYLYNIITKNRKKSNTNSQDSRSLSKYVNKCHKLTSKSHGSRHSDEIYSANDATTSKNISSKASGKFSQTKGGSRKSSLTSANNSNSNRIYSGMSNEPKWIIKHHNKGANGLKPLQGYHDNMRNYNSKRMRQQRLLDKVANLGSSPINVLQAIAAKALNFKLKNSVSFAQIAENLAKSESLNEANRQQQQQQQQQQASSLSSLVSRPMTSAAASEIAGTSSTLTNIEEITSAGHEFQLDDSSSNPKQTISSVIICEIDESSTSKQSTESALPADSATNEATTTSISNNNNLLSTTNNQLFIDVDSSTSSSSCSIDYKKSTKRLREDNNEQMTNDDTDKNSFPKDVEMEEQTTSESKNIKIEEIAANESGQQQASGIPSNLFSVLRLWMSKRVDSINSIKSPQQQSTDESRKAQNASQMNEDDCCTTKKTAANQSTESSQQMPDQHQDLFDLVQLNKLKRNELRKELRKMKKLSQNLSNDREASSSNNNNKKIVDSRYFDKRIVSRRKEAAKKSSLVHKNMNARGMKDYYHDRGGRKFTTPVQIIKLDMLQHLSLRNLGNDVIDRNMLNSLLKNFKCLKYLDISNCCTNSLSAQPAIMFASSSVTGVSENNLDGLENLAPTLIYLIMADLTVNDIQGNLKHLLKLKKLKHLDISNCVEKSPLNIYKNASLTLAKLAYHLNSLNSLDISGTNLGGPIIFKEAEEIDYIQKRLYEDLIDENNDYQRVRLDRIETIKSSVSGLMFLNNGKKKLDFLGCFCCDNSVSSRPVLPAIRIAGEESEKHLYTSLETYMQDRPLFLLDALNHLFELYKDELITDNLLGGHLIMDTMERHLDNSRIQISGSASLFYVLKYSKEENVQMPYFYLTRLIRTVINGMEEHIDESAMRRNCVLIMCRLNLPDDVLFVSDRLIKILLKIFDDYITERNVMPATGGQENFVLRTAMHLLNILACSVHGNDKFIVGSQAIPVAMNLIRTKTRFNEADDILEVTWSFLWNITDETPENCKIFLDLCEGMKTFMDCIKFKKSEIIRNMMGLLGNVAEVKELRNRLCKNDFIRTFRELLFQNSDGIEIPYNSAGVLVHIMSDGVEVWDQSDCKDQSRESVIEDIETAIDKWNLESDRNINYRSFEPIFRLVNQYQNPICQRWACWALANLTTVYPEVYCPLFERENGNDILNKLISFENVNPKIRNFAEIVLKNVFNYNKSNAN